jgi:hypothetical protein
MATKLDKPVTREVALGDVTLNVTMTKTGITVRGKGTQREVTVDYASLVDVAPAPSNMPAKYTSCRLDWLGNKPTPKPADSNPPSPAVDVSE